MRFVANMSNYMSLSDFCSVPGVMVLTQKESGALDKNSAYSNDSISGHKVHRI